jgi:hypothetical protein
MSDAGRDDRERAAGRAPTQRVGQATAVRFALNLPNMRAMWTFLAGDGYQADPDALRAEFPEIDWTRFADWAGKALGGGPAGVGPGW